MVYVQFSGAPVNKRLSMYHKLYYITGCFRLSIGILLLWLPLFYTAFDSSYSDYLGSALLTSCYISLVEYRRLSFPMLIIFSFAPEVLVNLFFYGAYGLSIVLIPEIIAGLLFVFAIYMDMETLTNKN